MSYEFGAYLGTPEIYLEIQKAFPGIVANLPNEQSLSLNLAFL